MRFSESPCPTGTAPHRFEGFALMTARQPEGTGVRTKGKDMTDTELLDRITVRGDVFGGEPIIRDMRIAVEHVLAMLAAGDTAAAILEEYPDLDAEDIRACLLYAHRSLAGEQVHDRVAVRKAL